MAGEGTVLKAAGNVGSGLAASALSWLVASTGISVQPLWAKIIAAVGFVAGVVVSLTYRRYAAIITRKGPAERAAYDALRDSLCEGG